MKVKIKLEPGAVMPRYAHKEDAGMDLTAISESIINREDYGYIEYDTGVRMEIENGYFADIRPRSSISEKGLILANSPGTIDSNYRGTIKIRFKWIPNTAKYSVGDRVAQMIIMKKEEVELEEVNALEESSRGEGAFGSTDKS